MRKLYFLLAALCPFLTRTPAGAQVFNAALNTKAGLNASAPDNFGNFYVGGIFANTTLLGTNPVTAVGNNDAWIARYDGTGTFLWERHGGGTGNDKVWKIITDATGNLYAFMTFNGTFNWDGQTVVSNGADDILVVKYSPSGALLWKKQIGSAAVENGNYVFMNLDNSGNLHINTEISTGLAYVGTQPVALTNGPHNLVHFKLNGATGASMQNTQFGASPASVFVGSVMTTDNAGNVYSVVYANGNGTIGGVPTTAAGTIFAKTAPNGSLIWQKVFPFFNAGYPSMVVDNSGNITLAGDWDTQFNCGDTSFTQTSVVSDDIFIVNYNASGTMQWAKRWGSLVGTDGAQNLMLNNAGQIVVAGIAGGNMAVDNFTLAPQSADFFIARISPSGTVLSAMSSAAPQSEVIFSAGIDVNDNMTITGGIMPPTNFGPFYFSDPQTQYYAVYMTGNACEATGRVFRDYNNNAVLNATDAGLPNTVVMASPGGYYAMSGQNGDYALFTLPGTYTLSVPNPPLYHLPTTAATQSAMFSALGQLDTANHFGFYPIPGMRDLVVNVSSLVPARPGHIAAYVVTYRNVGTDTVTNGTVALGYTGPAYFTANPAYSWAGTDSLRWNFTNLLPGETRGIQIYLNIPTSAMQGTQYPMPVTVSSPVADQTPGNNHVPYSINVVSSYDPNAKSVTPAAVAPAYVTSGGWFEYTIRFQNTGNDTAFTVLLRDTLDNKLDAGTLEVLGSSHPVKTTIRNGRILEFLFPDILLPDSNVNELMSHGQVTFRIKAPLTLPTPTVINNRAAIYFDYNLPVITNNAPVVIGTLSVGGPGGSGEPFLLYPNPASDALFIHAGSTTGDTYSIAITDVHGRTVLTRALPAGTTVQVSTADWATGMYFARLVKNGTCIGSQKIMIAR